jgi:tRNA-dihydrouridine synthase
MLGRAIFGNPWLFNSSKHLFERIPLSAASPPLHRTASYGSHGDSLLSRSASQKGALSTNNEDALEIVSIEERLRVMVEHTRLFEELLGTYKSFSVMKKHYKAYVHGFDGAKELRSELMETNSAEEVAHIVERFLMAGR